MSKRKNEKGSKPGQGKSRKETVVFGTPKAAEQVRSEPAATDTIEPPAADDEADEADDADADPSSRRAHLPDAPSGPSGTIMLDAPTAPPREPTDGRAARDAPSASSPPGSRGTPAPGAARARAPQRRPRPPPAPAPLDDPDSDDDVEDDYDIVDPPSIRTSLLLARRKNRTTIAELSDLAERLTLTAEKRLPIGRKVAIASAISVALVTLVTTALATGTWRWLLWIVAFAAITALTTVGGVRALKGYARRKGARVLPGGPLVWLGGGAVAIGFAAGILTWGLSEATGTLAVAVFPGGPKPRAPEPEEPPREVDLDARADAVLKRTGHVFVAGGVLHAPRSFESEDGTFDLVVHFHGNTELVEESVAQARINALVHIVNVGLGSGPYEDKYSVPAVFEEGLHHIEERAVLMGLKNAKLRRLALISWSAGYGALAYILKDKAHREQIDAVLLLDSLHLGWVDEGKGEVNQAALEPFAQFAKEAMAGRKLMVVTHSAVQTHGYASTTQSANALLALLELERTQVDAGASPPAVEFDAALRAVPKSTRKLLEARSEVRKGLFSLLGYSGETTEDHMAHLVQMSVTVLPALRERWK